MRGYRTVLAAAALAVAGVMAGAPAQAAAIRATPAVQVDKADSGVQLVHKRRYRNDGRYYRRYVRRYDRPRYVYKEYYPRPYYGYPYYYDRRPGVSLQFSFGGGGYRHW